MTPTSQQILIIKHDGNAVVIAAPGSGKTFVISEKIKRNLKLLLEHQGIIAISYTNKASLELKKRSLSNGENPMSSFFGTIDKFFLSEIIIPFAKQLFGLPSKQIKIIKIISLPYENQNDFIWFNRNLSLGQITQGQIEIFKSYFLSGLIMIETIGVFANYVFTNSTACKNYIKARYKYIYIDEYQDSGLEQHQIFLKIKSLNIIAVAVGDLNQSIYAFSGKDAKYLEELTKDETFKYFKLDKNHRCHPSIINYSNYLLDPRTELIPVKDKLIFFHRIKGNERDIALWIDNHIVSVEKTFNIASRNNIAILTRNTRTADTINLELKVPHKLSMSNELDLNLNIWSGIFSDLLHFIFDVNFKFIDVIESIISYDRINSIDLKKLSISKKALEEMTFEKKIDNERLKKEFINIASVIAPNSENTESVELLTMVLNNVQELKSYEPANENEINIMTLHKSKGLEFDFVFHLDLYEWVFPNKRPGPNNDFNNPVYGDWKQDLNLHYVGITRARKGCSLISSTKRTNNEGHIRNGADSEFIWKDDIADLRYQKEIHKN